jgi:hypothetical protein
MRIYDTTYDRVDVLFMGLIYQEMVVFHIGLSLITINIWSIRNQFMITETQYNKNTTR